MTYKDYINKVCVEYSENYATYSLEALFPLLNSYQGSAVNARLLSDIKKELSAVYNIK